MSGGRANQVEFDPAKESRHILAMQGRGCGECFKLLGVIFDVGLTMETALHDIAREASWRLATILRTSRCFCTRELVGLYKSRILSYIESKTAAIYHACDSHLAHLDRVQQRFLREIEVSEEEALIVYNLAPLSTRRDVAMLGLVHRTVLGLGPVQFEQFFRPARHQTAVRTRAAYKRRSRQLEDLLGSRFLEIERRSALGLAGVYNLLPEEIVQAPSVSLFQSGLQDIVKERACSGIADWPETCSPRIPLFRHPLM